MNMLLTSNYSFLKLLLMLKVKVNLQVYDLQNVYCWILVLRCPIKITADVNHYHRQKCCRTPQLLTL